jgi:hypothetical protein
MIPQPARAQWRPRRDAPGECAPRSLDCFPVSFDGDRVIVDTGRLDQSVPQPDRASRLFAIPDIGRCLDLD